MRRKLLQPPIVVVEQAVLSIVNVNAGCDVHRVDEAESFLHPTLVDELFNGVRYVEIIPPMWRLEPEMFGERFHSLSVPYVDAAVQSEWVISP